jgi:prepilin-type processing-associated H-X9-DG protein
MKVNGSNEWGWLLYSFHTSGVNAAYGDGSVRFVRESAQPRVLGMLATRAGGEITSD